MTFSSGFHYFCDKASLFSCITVPQWVTNLSYQAAPENPAYLQLSASGLWWLAVLPGAENHCFWSSHFLQMLRPFQCVFIFFWGSHGPWVPAFDSVPGTVNVVLLFFYFIFFLCAMLELQWCLLTSFGFYQSNCMHVRHFIMSSMPFIWWLQFLALCSSASIFSNDVTSRASILLCSAHSGICI